MRTVILAGGRGTRLGEETADKPKPMADIGGKPILWHILNIFAAYAFRDFIIALGYKGEIIKRYFLNFNALNNDFSIDLKNSSVSFSGPNHCDWKVDLVDTGTDTQTGGRIRRLRPWLQDERFILTYGDGVANVDIRALVAFHQTHGRLATITAVRPPARFGRITLDGDRVVEYAEKPQIGEGWVNGGFFVLEPAVISYIDDDATVWERGPLERLAQDNQLMAYRHEGFWQPMDTMRDKILLEHLWHNNEAPWKIWR